MENFKKLTLLAVLGTFLGGCYVKHSKPYYVYAPDMHYSVALKAQEEGATRTS